MEDSDTVDPWPDKRCLPSPTSDGYIHLLQDTLADASDERPLQTFLAAHPHLLTALLAPGQGAWCWDRPRFGGELIPDFLLCTRNSTGEQWVMVELESPTQPPLTRAGLPTAKLNEALGQVRDWRAWVRQNIAYAHQQLGFRGLTAESPAYVIIGRRSAINAKHTAKYRELSSEKTTVMTYDRLIETIRRGRVMTGAQDG